MNYEDLLRETESMDLSVKEKPLKFNDGRIKGKKILIRSTITTYSKKNCVLAEEIGHHLTAVGDITDQSKTENRKQERKGRIYAYDKLIGLSGLVNAYKRNCRDQCEIAEYLDVTEEFLSDALRYYHQKYGLCAEYDGYLIYFDKLGILKLLT